MKRLGIGIGAALLVLAGASLAEDVDKDPCKNHYILVDDCPDPSPVAKSPNSFRFTKVYSSPSGYDQAVQMVEMDGSDGQHHWAGLTFIATDRHGGERRFTIPHDLPSERTAHRSVVLATHGDELTSDFTLPTGFVPTDGGTLELTGIDRWEIGALPQDGIGVLTRYAAIVPDPTTPSPFITFRGMGWPAYNSMQGAIEFRHAESDRYFITMLAAEIEALDDGRVSGWARTGEAFVAWINRYYDPYEMGEMPPRNLRPVCRLYLPPPGGPTHFYSASQDECALALSNIPGMVLETSRAFLATLPDASTGQCPPEGAPLYRLWNRDASGVSHRFTPRKATRDAMVAQGWVSEGYGPDGVAMCTHRAWIDR